MILTTLVLFTLSANAAGKEARICENVANFTLKQNGYKSLNGPGKKTSDSFTHIFALPGKNTVRVGFTLPPSNRSFISIDNEKLAKSRVFFLDTQCRITSVTDEVRKVTTHRFTADLCNSMLDNKSKKKTKADEDRAFIMTYKRSPNHKDIIIDDQKVDEVINFCTAYKPYLHTYVKEEKSSPKLTKTQPRSNNKGH
jgi:hypothetical protein